jgi:cyclic di-GMP phosphodiesterase
MSDRILVVDDDPNILNLVADVLREAGFSVAVAADGRQALEQAEASRPELVLLDLTLPGISGWQVHERLLAEQPQTPVIFMTAASRARSEAEAHQAAGYLAKPFDLDVLLQTVIRFTTPPHNPVLPALSQLKGEVGELLESSDRNLEALGESLLRALWMRDVGTGAHSLRVAGYALQLCKRLGLSEDERKTIGVGALLHDVGKIGIPDSILLKPGPLDEREWDEIRGHPLYGRRLIEPFRGADAVWRLVYAHHERVDGRGYPEGLSGQQLTLGMRIVILTDAFDSMTTRRPYRPPLSRENAIVQLRVNAGTQFDSGLVRVFIDMISANHGTS